MAIEAAFEKLEEGISHVADDQIRMHNQNASERLRVALQ
jgi:hypothetical protein